MPDPFSLRKPARQSRARDTIDTILDAAARLVTRDEAPLSLSTNRIAEIAGVSIGSLYQYFPGKDAILHALIEREFNKIVDGHVAFIEAIDPAVVPLADAIQRIVDRVCAGVVQQRPLYRQVALSVLSIRHLAFTIENDTRVRDAVRGKLAMYPEVDHTQLDVITFVALHALKGIQIGSVLAGHPLDGVATRETIGRMLVACVLTPAGAGAARSRSGTD
jgi:AcrR family transcriptional regulator